MGLNRREVHRLLTEGYFAVNKPKNWTSVQALEEIKKVLRKDIPTHFQPPVLKLGHGGTLDHTATGVLAVGVGWGCKLLPIFLHGDKKYIAAGRFGIATNTYNETGKITEEMKYDHITEEIFEITLQKYTGKIYQTPPKYSALKYQGRRIGDWTREGMDIEMKPRPVTCYSLKSRKFCLPHFEIEVACGGGFYVRSLVHDIGQALSSCAHVTTLHRTKHGPFMEEDMLEHSQWNGHNIIRAIYEAKIKYHELLKKSKAKYLLNSL
ncbi:hypothetical protein R5R35_012107 [Gryllus longicercus]|uniref:tRNA pseudouridine(55) synthase n=1 Tax=Gryllus longicercus TaxID=2509291 RepID=A0AAN9W6K1_9ORTH